MINLFKRNKSGRATSLMSKYQAVKAWYSYTGIYNQTHYDNTKPLYISIFSYIDDENTD